MGDFVISVSFGREDRHANTRHLLYYTILPVRGEQGLTVQAIAIAALFGNGEWFDLREVMIRIIVTSAHRHGHQCLGMGH